MIKLKLLLLLGIVLTTSVSYAGTLRFDFSGLTFLQLTGDDDPVFTGSYVGFFLIDDSVEDTGPSPFFSFFENSLIDGSVTINDTVYGLMPGGLNRSGITNNAGGSFDSFFVTADVISSAGETAQFGLQLVDMSNMLFDNTTLPSMLTIDQFDPIDHQTINGTLAFLISTQPETMTVEYAYLRPVPLPSSLVLLMSAVIGLARLTRTPG